MRLTAMRFKDYTWPHNPEVYTVENRRRVAVHQVPFGRCVLQELGGSYRVFRGEGAFVGRDAYEQFKELETVFQSEGPGQLIHPVWQARPAYFVSLRLTEEPVPEYVRYSFEFWEDYAGYQTGVETITPPKAAAEPAACGNGRRMCPVSSPRRRRPLERAFTPLRRGIPFGGSPKGTGRNFRR